MNRRAFLTGVAATGVCAAVGGMTACSSDTKKKDSSKIGDSGTGFIRESPKSSSAIEWLGEPPDIDDDSCHDTLEYEVVVVGAGTSGYFAAAASAESGLKTLLIEKSTKGNGIRTSAMGAVGSSLQQEVGVEINTVELLSDLDRYASGGANLELMRLWAEHSGEALDWYADFLSGYGMEVQLEWNMPEDTRYTQWPCGHGTNGEYPSREEEISQLFNEHISSYRGCEVLFSTSMKSLIVEKSKVVGLYAEDKRGENIRINASLGVVVATGGYAHNREMYTARHAVRYSCLGAFDAFTNCEGDGIQALMWIGAQLEETPTSYSVDRCTLRSEQKVGNPYAQGFDYGYFFFGSQPFLRVDPEGKRFHNESSPSDYVFSASAQRAEDKRFWHQIWDSNWEEDIARFHTTGSSTISYREGADHDAWPSMIEDWIIPEMDDFIEQGFIPQADTLEELAEKLGISDVEAFLNTCKRQNENYEAGIDSDFGKEPFRLSRLELAPFYGTKAAGITLCTLDGIRVNENMQPLDAEGSIIEGVYVVGNDQGGCFAGTYPDSVPGLNAGRCATFGRMVGKILATSKKTAKAAEE